MIREYESRTQAADAETVTWGAIDPTWSPDSQRLALSLFGSIWQVPAAGGEAQQVTTSGGYHAHPAWSPKGDQIAFVRGDNPAGRIPNISGRLVLVDAATGQEREIATPEPVAGTLAWSPDGARLACALRSNAGALLHEVTVATGAVRQIQFPPQGGGGVSPWVDAAWNPKMPELFFAAQRVGAPQIWSMDPGGPANTVQMPLTRYRPGDIVLLDRVSALADGSGVVYSAVVVNGKGDYELYRAPRYRGGPIPAPVALTNTTRDEFAPAVSPDGARIAHVSNHLGNIDIFTMPVAGGAKSHVRLASLKFRAPSGRLRVRVLDEQGKPTPVRLYVRASDGKAYCPPGTQIFYYALEPGRGREGFFVASGDDTFPVPAGNVTLVAFKGLEYDVAERTVPVDAGATAETTLQMRRWTNWMQRGWYTGENHFHANYNGSYYQRPRQSLAWLEAEDLNAANMIVANAAGAFVHDKEFFRGAVDPLSTSRYILYWGQEYRNSYPLGHQAFLNIRQQVPPSYTSVIGSDSPYDFPLNTMAALEAKKQGGLVSYVHPMGFGRDVFDTSLGAKEAPVGAALGAVDAIDILPFGEGAYELWYRFLNAGFKISAGAGTDVFTNWRGINSIPGGARQYVEVGPSLSWDRWVERLRQGRSFVTNGPLVTFTVNGEPLGAEIRAPSGTPYRARLVAEVSARSPLERVEIVQNGMVIETRDTTAQEVRVEQEVEVRASSWFAVRVRGRPARGIVGGGLVPRAHTSPIYVLVGGAPVLVKQDVELMIRWVDRLQELLEERNNYGPGDNRDRAHRMLAQAREHYQKKAAAAP
jgi:Tol biopolymer transport system component